VLLSAFGSVQDAVAGDAQGAADFLGKPFAPEQVLVAVDRALEKTALQTREPGAEDRPSTTACGSTTWSAPTHACRRSSRP
jgi:DNA-binding NtrC family response regulator